MKVYVVTHNTGLDYGGDSCAIAGVYSTKVDAIKQIVNCLGDKLTDIDNDATRFDYDGEWDYNYYEINELELDKEFEF